MTIQKVIIGLDDLVGADKELLKSTVDETTQKFPTAAAFDNYFDFYGCNYLELSGAWEDQCISCAVVESLNRDISVKVPKKYIFKSNKDKPDLPIAIAFSGRLSSKKYLFRETTENYYFFPKNILNYFRIKNISD
jgi:hypothetical protein